MATVPPREQPRALIPNDAVEWEEDQAKFMAKGETPYIEGKN